MPTIKEQRYARSCYGHLAGVLGVAVAGAMLKAEILQLSSETAYVLTDAGKTWFRNLGVRVELSMAPGADVEARRCLDGTERRHHLGGPLGVALLRRMLELEWLERPDAGRALKVTASGVRAFQDHLGLEVQVNPPAN